RQRTPPDGPLARSAARRPGRRLGAQACWLRSIRTRAGVLTYTTRLTYGVLFLRRSHTCITAVSVFDAACPKARRIHFLGGLVEDPVIRIVDTPSAFGNVVVATEFSHWELLSPPTDVWT